MGRTRGPYQTHPPVVAPDSAQPCGLASPGAQAGSPSRSAARSKRAVSSQPGRGERLAARPRPRSTTPITRSSTRRPAVRTASTAAMRRPAARQDVLDEARRGRRGRARPRGGCRRPVALRLLADDEEGDAGPRGSPARRQRDGTELGAGPIRSGRARAPPPGARRSRRRAPRRICGSRLEEVLVEVEAANAGRSAGGSPPRGRPRRGSAPPEDRAARRPCSEELAGAPDEWTPGRGVRLAEGEHRAVGEVEVDAGLLARRRPGAGPRVPRARSRRRPASAVAAPTPRPSPGLPRPAAAPSATGPAASETRPQARLQVVEDEADGGVRPPSSRR